MPSSLRSAAPLDLCGSYARLCNDLLDSLQCPAADPDRIVGGCAVAGAVTSFVAACACGAYDVSGRVSEMLLDSQLPRALVAAAEVRVWPTVVASVDDPLGVIDLCLTYENACDALLTRLNCPVTQRALNSCDRRGLSAFEGQCRCGGVAEGDVRVLELVIDETLNRRYDMVDVVDYPDKTPLDVCANYEALCSAWLDHVQCPAGARTVVGCAPGAAPFSYSAFVGACSCFGNAALGAVSSNRISEALMDALTYPSDVWPALARVAGGSGGAILIDGCVSYAAACGRVLSAVGCPVALQNVTACAGGNGANQSIASFVGVCTCGAFITPSRRVAQYLADAILASDISELTYAPPAVGAFALIAGSDPWKQLRAPRYSPPKPVGPG